MLINIHSDLLMKAVITVLLVTKHTLQFILKYRTLSKLFQAFIQLISKGCEEVK